MAKKKILSNKKPVSEIAYELGFKHPQFHPTLQTEVKSYTE